MAGALKKFRDKLAAFDFALEQKKIVAENAERIEQLQKEQMLQGRGSDGEYIRPFYSEDPYFKSPAAGRRYAGWKQKISPHPQRPFDVPNLYINGFYHNSIDVSVAGDKVVVHSSANFGSKIESKYPNALGLDPGMRHEFITETIIPSLNKILKEKTGLSITRVR